MRILRGGAKSGKNQIVAFFAVQSDRRDDEMIPAMPMPNEHIRAGGWDDVVRGRLYRDRKAPRMAARRKSRRMREIARWQDACFGA